MALILPNALVSDEFAKTVSDQFLRDATRSILKSYALNTSNPHIAQKLYEKRHRTNNRNGTIDSQLESIARRHFDIQGVFRDNCTGSYNYTELIVNDKVILTASTVDSPKRLPRASVSRLDGAMNNPEVRQLNIFASNLIRADFNNKTIQRKKLYGIILHGPAKSVVPEFIIVAIPDYTYSYHLATINLLERYSTSSEQETEIDLTVQEIEKPSAQLRVRSEEYIEDDERIVGEIYEDFGEDGGEGA